MTIPHPGIPDNTIKLRQQPVSGYPRKVLAVKSCPNRGQICLALCKGKGKAKQLIHPGETCWGHAFTGCCKMSAAFSERMHHPSPVLWPFPPPSRGKGSRWWAAGGRTFRTWTGAINQDIVGHHFSRALILTTFVSHTSKVTRGYNPRGHQDDLLQRFSKCGPKTSSISNTGELVGNAKSWAPPKTDWIRDSGRGACQVLFDAHSGIEILETNP